MPFNVILGGDTRVKRERIKNDYSEELHDMDRESLGFISLMDINLNTIKSYCRRYGLSDVDMANSGFCKMCRTPITQTTHTKKKEFCCNNCRVKWFYHKKKLVTELEAELNENFDDE